MQSSHPALLEYKFPLVLSPVKKLNNRIWKQISLLTFSMYMNQRTNESCNKGVHVALSISATTKKNFHSVPTHSTLLHQC